MPEIHVCALYRFVTLEDYRQLREPLLALMQEQHIRGTLLLASEGINGTVSGEPQAISNLLAWFDRDKRLANISHKISVAEEQPFYRAKVKLKKEIVTMGVEGVDPVHVVGTYVKPKDWNTLIRDPDVVLIDTRNDYEYQVGTFEGAVNPNTTSFREFPAYVDQHLDPEKNKKVAMFCTGGIRCEKSTAYLKQQGFDEVYHLEGGILQYLEDVPEENSLWRGECFVFDNRVTVDHQLQRGHYDQCHACRLPITEEDKQHEHYEAGVSCPHCYGKKTQSQLHRYQERQHQINLARQRGEEHIGEDATESGVERRKQKLDKKASEGAAARG